MSSIPYVISGSGRIAVVVNGRDYSVEPAHPAYKEIRQAIKDGNEALIVEKLDIGKVISDFTEGKIKILGGQILHGDRPIGGALVNRIMQFMGQQLPFEPLVKFLDNLMENPSKRAVDELYRWVDRQDCPITEDGCFLGYKYLNKAGIHEVGRPIGEPENTEIYVDVHSKTIRQWIGKVVTMERNQVDDNWGVLCSEGLHVGSSQYSYSGDVRVMVKVNPRDVVSVPTEDAEKLRTCAYEIIRVYEKDYNTPLVNAQGDQYQPPRQDEDLDDDDDDDYDDVEDGTRTLKIFFDGQPAQSLLQMLHDNEPVDFPNPIETIENGSTVWEYTFNDDDVNEAQITAFKEFLDQIKCVNRITED
jgi:hypothetical protein